MSIAIVQSEFGGPETLEVANVTPPTAADLQPDEVLVKVAAARVNPIDVMTRTGGGMAAAGVVKLPYTPGWDVAGTVEAVGSEVSGLTQGQRVCGMVRFPAPGSTYAEYTVVPATHVVPAPESLTDEQAAALPLAAMTAWQACADTADLQPGQRVLISGAGGGVGHLAVQIAHELGAWVIAVASEGKHQWLRDLGADETIDYRDADAMAALAHSVDVALSLAAGSREATLRAVRPDGLLIALGGGADSLDQEAEQAGIRFAATHVRTERDWLEQVTKLAAKGALVPEVSLTFPLADAAEAHRAIENGHGTGKIVLVP